MSARPALAVVGIVLLVSGAAKVVDGTPAAVALLRVTESETLSRFGAAILAGLETGLGAILLLRGARIDAGAAALLLLLMTAWIVGLDVAYGMDTPCGCHVPLLGDRGWAPLVRNVVLLALCVPGLRARTATPAA